MLCELLDHDLPEQQHAFGGCQSIAKYTRLIFVIVVIGFPCKSKLNGLVRARNGL